MHPHIENMYWLMTGRENKGAHVTQNTRLELRSVRYSSHSIMWLLVD